MEKEADDQKLEKMKTLEKVRIVRVKKPNISIDQQGEITIPKIKIKPMKMHRPRNINMESLPSKGSLNY